MLKRLALLWIPILLAAAMFQTASFSVGIVHAAVRSALTPSHHAIPLRPQTTWRRLHANASAPFGKGDLQYNNGPVQEHPSAYVILWGPNWSNGSGGVTSDAQVVLKYFNDMGGTAFENTLTQYYDQTVHITDTMRFVAAFLDPSTPPTDTTCGGGPTIEDADIQNEVNYAIGFNGWANDGANSTYFVYTPPGDIINGTSVGVGCSNAPYPNGFCGYHFDFNNGTTLAYAELVYPHPGCLLSGPTPNGDVNGDTLASVTSHEQFEAATDPQPFSGWIDGGGYEIGDKCAWDFSNGNTQLNNGDTFMLQSEYSNATHTCVNFARTWYFAEGFTGGSFSEYLTLANPTSSTAHVGVSYLLASGSPITKTYNVNANARSTIKVNNEVGSGKSVSMVVMADQPIVAERPMYFTYTGLPGYTIPGGTDVLGATALATQFDFGYLDTTAGHDTYLTILNDNGATMIATIQYFAADGSSTTLASHTINGNSRGTVHVNKEGLPAGTYSALVTLSLPGLVERPMYLKDAGTGDTGAADIVGARSTLRDWYFAEGFTSANFSERYILANPSSTMSANVTVTFLRSNGTTASSSVTLAPGVQTVVSANTVLGNGVNNSAHVHANAPILAERFMSFVYHGAVGGSSSSTIPGATDVLGAPSLATQLEFAEGFTGNNFAEYLTIENTAASATNVQVTFLPSNGAEPTVKTYSVGASTRFTLNTASVMPGQSFSMVVQSASPILAERPMYFTFAGSQTGGTDVIGYEAAGASAQGGNLWLTGHDADFHCGGYAQCNYLQVAVNFVRNGSTLPILALDHGTEVAYSISIAFGLNAPTVTTVDPRSGFASLPLVSPSGAPLYSAIVVASDITCGGCDNNDGAGITPDSDAINARAGDIAQFFNAGGGILALAGADNSNVFYNFVPIPVTGTSVTAPFTLTPLGLSLGLQEGPDDNCCPTHNSFDLPAPDSPLQVAELDGAGLAETLVASNVTAPEASALPHVSRGPVTHQPTNESSGAPTQHHSDANAARSSSTWTPDRRYS